MGRIRLDSSCRCVVGCIAGLLELRSAYSQMATIDIHLFVDSYDECERETSVDFDHELEVATRRRRGGDPCSEPHLTCVSLSP